MRKLLFLSLFFAGAVACADLKTASPAPDTDSSNADAAPGTSTNGATGSSGNTGTSSGNTALPRTPNGNNAAALGALPSGYCCNADSECRFGKCSNGMCLDHCYSAGICKRDDVTFTCDAVNHDEGSCQPPAGFQCLPANTYVQGNRPVGGCCTATGDGNAGSECEGNLCIAIGDGPFVCTQRCKTSNDCPSDYQCYELDPGYKQCIPGNPTYVCK